jgi:hypothetical protein
MAKSVPTTASDLCDPCQFRERGSKDICGFQGKSLGPHLKAHKITIALYRKKYKGFSTGVPSYSPPPEAVAKMSAALPHNKDKAALPTSEEKAAAESEYEAAINARMEELWSMCERDPAARMICLAAAKDESMLNEAYGALEALRNAAKPDTDLLKYLNANVESTSRRLNENMKSLSLTVKQRRDSNQLGSDSVSQLICGYANTLRKMSPEKQENFHRRVATVEANMAERIRVKLLDHVDDGFDKAEKVIDATDFRAAILRFNPEAV